MIETRRLKNVGIFFQTILSFVLSRKIIHNLCIGYNNGNAYRINFVFMSKTDALNLIKNAVIIDKKGVL